MIKFRAHFPVDNADFQHVDIDGMIHSFAVEAGRNICVHLGTHAKYIVYAMLGIYEREAEYMNRLGRR